MSSRTFPAPHHARTRNPRVDGLSPLAADAFHVVPLSAAEWALLLALACPVIAVDEVRAEEDQQAGIEQRSTNDRTAVEHRSNSHLCAAIPLLAAGRWFVPGSAAPSCCLCLPLFL